MKRIVLDTNIYGFMAKDDERSEIVEKIKTSKLIIYGFKIIRNELREVPKQIKVGGKSFRIDILNLYDSIVENHLLEFTDKIETISENYYKAYREFGGIKQQNEIINDFIIVSAASLNNLDIVVSNDEKSMLTVNAVRAYNLVNSIINKRTPEFINYPVFKRMLRGEPNELI